MKVLATKKIAQVGNDFVLFSQDKLLERTAAEKNESLRQLIPYIVLRHGDKIALFQRTKNSGEVRLHGKHTIGVGGHIEPCDIMWASTGMDIIMNASRRELIEEVNFFDNEHEVGYPNCEGFIINNETLVDRVHLGILFFCEVTTPLTPLIKAKSNELRFVRWEYPSAIDRSMLEGWSVTAIELLLKERDDLPTEWTHEETKITTDN